MIEIVHEGCGPWDAFASRRADRLRLDVYASYSEDVGDVVTERLYCQGCASTTTGQGTYALDELDLFFGTSKSAGLALVGRTMSVRMNDYFVTRPDGVPDKPHDTWWTFSAGVVLRF
jgi:hypothetical protein